MGNYLGLFLHWMVWSHKNNSTIWENRFLRVLQISVVLNNIVVLVLVL